MSQNQPKSSKVQTNKSKAKIKGLAFVFLAYVVASIAAYFTGKIYLQDKHPLLVGFVCDVLATVVVFAFSVIAQNSSLYDPYWSVLPVPLFVYFLQESKSITYGYEPNLVRQVMVLIVVSIWSLRLTWNWIRGWSGLKQEDWRYVDLQKSCGRFYWIVSFLGIHMFPTILVYLGCMSFWPSLTSSRAINVFDLLAFSVCLMGVSFEFFADNQLRSFVLAKHPKGSILKTGIWAWSRHPNYFGEISFWWGIWLFSLATKGPYVNLAGPVGMTVLFCFISLPMIEKRHLKSRPKYPEYAKTTPAIFPFPPSKAKSPRPLKQD
ncbi:3-oxo-5-alpha-steroid 4-dehydrogenase [Anaeramoeba flamelloides]|uniref:3-oxo-5-alpha-steroid 4-dehydrogenase n=1 Tax=Anaeramoeba flamelloides TaxID=1746091 RepID=A0ABQ8YNS7_9EUKA|nr:3-oxo-5-alpha-steroid 4-dehydrogenase [Anaeramoeba flamelloides]